MLLNFLMLSLLVGLFVLCAALVRFAEGIIRPQEYPHDKARRETL
jgi:hypothetical protein